MQSRWDCYGPSYLARARSVKELEGRDRGIHELNNTVARHGDGCERLTVAPRAGDEAGTFDPELAGIPFVAIGAIFPELKPPNPVPPEPP